MANNYEDVLNNYHKYWIFDKLLNGAVCFLHVDITSFSLNMNGEHTSAQTK